MMINMLRLFLLILLILVVSLPASATSPQIRNHKEYKESVELIQQLGKKELIRVILREQDKYIRAHGNDIDPYTKGTDLTSIDDTLIQTITVDIDKLLNDINEGRRGEGKGIIRRDQIYPFFAEGGYVTKSQVSMICGSPSTRASIDNDIEYIYKFYDKGMNLIKVITIDKEACQRSDSTEIVIPITYKEYHDPGYIKTAEGGDYTFGYKGITYENISSWEAGRTILLVYNPADGVRIYDPISKVFAEISHIGKHPIDLLESGCEKEAVSIAGIAACYERSFHLWSADIENNYKRLKTLVSPEMYQEIMNMRVKWISYRDSKNSVNREIHKNEGGTISIIESASRARGMVRDHGLYVNSLLSQAKENSEQ